MTPLALFRSLFAALLPAVPAQRQPALIDRSRA
jgi:hypothetical protein